jgi:UDP-N-acetylglucosamine 2-epimerase (non-hydrolysing)/GDP/UDP-N,N'-diacetylbacillosamine 2-epimerase (hydrolysing)
MLLSSDTPEGISKSIGLGVIGFAQIFARFKPDILVVLGDRFEMLSAVAAAMPFTIPVAHLHGGEATEGLIDESIRHSITKMSHLHFVSTESYRQRVIQMGEAPWRVVVSGAPGLDNLQAVELLEIAALENRIGVNLTPPPLLVTFHPVTLEYADTQYHITELLAALKAVNLPIVFSYPNADTYGRIIINAIERFVKSCEQAWAVTNLGTQAYFSLMKYAVAMVGNSSSGIIEAASFELPVVNIGNRQQGRIHSYNVVDVECNRTSIELAIRQVTAPQFRAQLAGIKNPYGDGHAAERIVEVLQTVSLNQTLTLKRFHNILPGEANSENYIYRHS